MRMNTHGEGPGFGPGFGGEPVSGRTVRDLSSPWAKEMEGVFCTSPYLIGAKVLFALDLLYLVARSCWELIA